MKILRTYQRISFQFISFLLVLIFANRALAQDMQVARCSAIDQKSPVTNVYVDESNNKWVATSRAVYQIQALDLANAVKLNADEQSLLSISGGNQDVRWKTDELQAIIGADNKVSAAFYDIKKEELWIGTQEAGAFQLKVKPQLKLVNKFDNTNSKIKSNAVNSIYIDQIGEVWIGTEEGALVGKGGRWTLEERLLSIGRITEYGSNVWVLGNNAIWKVTSRGDWIAVDVEAAKIEGDIQDIAIDSAGRLWIASEVITRFDTQTDEYTFFGPIQYYTSQYATSIAVDKEGAVWVGTQDKGVYLIGKASAVMNVNAVVDKELGCDAAKNDAALRVKVSGGKAPYTYAWTSGLNGENPQNLAPGDYVVTVTDSEGKSKTAKVTIQNQRFTVQVAQDKEESAGGAADGAASVTIAGAATDFSFKWDNGETTKSAKKLTTGNHTVVVTDKKGCSATGNITIGQQLAALAIKIDQLSPIQCLGDKNSALKVTVTGGKAPFQYKWNDPTITGDQPKGLAAGTYQLQVIDAAGNNSSAIISIKAPEVLTAIAQVQASASTGNADAKAAVQAKGGSGNYTYKWDNGEVTQTAVKLNPGKHTATITDANGCNTTASVDVSENVLPLAISIFEKASIKCAGDANAAIAVQVTGGKAPFQYQWSDAKITGNEPTGLAAGNYQVTVTDAANGKATLTIVVKPVKPIVSTIQMQAPASTGKADAKALAQTTGGTGKYTFKWDNGETTETATRLNPGKHTLTVTDENGCNATASINVSENILPLAISIIEKTSIKCANEASAALVAQISGGKAPFQYLWSDTKMNGETPTNVAAGTYQLTVTDAAGTKFNASITIKTPEALSVNIQAQNPASTGNADGKAIAKVKGGTSGYTYKWDNGETTFLATKLAPGTRNVTVTDVNGCTTTGSIQITENILPLAVAISEKTTIKCAGANDAAIAVQVSGGKAPFQYQWSDTKLKGENPNNVSAGTYQLTITDAAGTKSNASINIKSPEILTVNIQAQAPASTGNSDGKAVAQVKGGAGNYTFKWSNGETAANAVKLAPTKHTVTITDANACTTTASIEITENILPLAVNIIEKTKIRCAGATDAALQVQVSGGKQPYQFKWNNPKATGENPTGLNAGAYEVTVTDATGAIKTTQVSINQPTALAAEVSDLKMATSATVLDGKATVQAKGGAGNYTYQWTNGETTAAANKLAPGNNVVTVTDANGCTATANFETPQRILAALSGTLRSGQTIRMDKLQFEADSSRLNEPSLPVITELYDFLKENTGVSVEIGGHTNSLPPDEVCDRLSTARAKSVVDYLIQKGVEERRLTFKGYGKRVPIADNGTPEGRQQNQRVEIKILRIAKPSSSGG